MDFSELKLTEYPWVRPRILRYPILPYHEACNVNNNQSATSDSQAPSNHTVMNRSLQALV
jgi:hypothetical protein